VICVSTASDQICIWDTEANENIEDLTIYGGFGAYLEDLRDKVLSKKLIYEEGLGLVSIS